MTRGGRTAAWAAMIAVGSGLAGLAAQQNAPSLRGELESILAAQAQAWNRGDLDAFMTPYWKSDELTFCGGGNTTHGWQATLDRYRARYDSREKMGTLTFDVDTVRPLGDSAALLLGRWRLKRERIGDAGGNFTLVFERIDGAWRIIHDHSSSLPTPASQPGANSTGG